MSEKQRTGAEIGLYCERLEELFIEAEAMKSVRLLSGAHAGLGALARTDLPRVLEAAVKLRALAAFACELANDDVEWEVVNEVLDETAWLAEPSPESALSPDGESGEGEG